METIQGTVVKVTEQHIVLLTNNGQFKNIPRSHSEVPLIGQSFTHIEKKRRRVPLFTYGSIAAALFLMLVTSFIFPFGGDAEEVYIISLDINPSIEIATNSNLEVIRAQGLNKAGVEILESIHWNDHLYTVIDQIIDQTVETGVMEKQEEPIVVTSVIPLQETSDELVSELKNTINISLNKNQTVVPIVVTLDEKEVYDEAKKSNLSINYYKEYKQLEEKGIVQSQKEISGKTISELKRMERQPKQESTIDKSRSSKPDIESENKSMSPKPEVEPKEIPKKAVPKEVPKQEDNKQTPPVKKEQKQPQENSNRGNQPENKGGPPVDRGKSDKEPAQTEKESKEGSRSEPSPVEQKEEERPDRPSQSSNAANEKRGP
ncbi:anti-sigma factor domain-containing protein [Alkalihalobacillus sp. BA299]|uniref:anti-sigma-I factor RsgI family protein n=1 Tax=Alkalihalobacillus sp. BA299 TaxID=2815938 RepID=UPI001ADC7965|nr:anti-sigma factor domain-containing protein [Alkalihalobacillus sp. BA299]